MTIWIESLQDGVSGLVELIQAFYGFERLRLCSSVAAMVESDRFVVPSMTKLAVAVELAVLLVVLGCGSAPTGPSDGLSSSALFDGAWTLEWQMDRCEGERHCSLRLGTRNSTTLRLTQLGQQVEGVLEVGYGVPVVGSISPGGELVLRGQAPAAGSMDSIGAVDAVVTVKSDLQRGLIGSLRYDSRPTYNPEVFGVYVRGGEILRATRSALRLCRGRS
jgi:hypothetical protein